MCLSKLPSIHLTQVVKSVTTLLAFLTKGRAQSLTSLDPEDIQILLTVAREVSWPRAFKWLKTAESHLNIAVPQQFIRNVLAKHLTSLLSNALARPLLP